LNGSLRVSRDPATTAADLLTAWTFADLVPEELRPLL
jgi:hypothetical protein